MTINIKKRSLIKQLLNILTHFNMTLKAKISEILEGKFSNYYTEREEIELAIAQLLALFDKEMKDIVGKLGILYDKTKNKS